MTEEMKTDRSVTVRQVASVPVLSTEAMQHVGKYANALVLSAFEQMGGLPMLVDWASQNRSDFYGKIFVKLMTRSTAVEHSGTLTIDDAINRLENAEFTEVSAYDL